MFCRRLLQLYIFLFMCAAQPALCNSLVDTIKKLFSFKVPASILDDVNRTILGKMSAKNIKFIFPNKLEIDEFEILDDQGVRALYGKHVKATISLTSLLTNNIRITNAFIDEPFFRYTIHKGVHNIINMFESPPQILEKLPPNDEGPRLRVTIEHVEVVNGNYEMFHDAGVEIFAEGIAAQGTFWVESGPFGVDIKQANIRKGAIFAAGMDLPITDLVAKKLWISDEKVSTEDLTARYEKAELTGKGTVFIEEERYDIHATLDAPKATYPTGLAPLPFVTPAFRARVAMAGELTEPEIAADVAFDDTDFNSLRINNGKVQAQINTHQVFVQSATVSIGEQGSLTGHGAVNIDKENFTFWSKIKNLFAEEVSTFLNFHEQTKGMIASDIKLTGQFANLDKNIRTEATGLIEHGELEWVRLRDRTNFDVNIDYVFGKRLSLDKLQLRDADGMRIAAHGKADLQKSSLALSYNGFFPNVGDYITLPNATDIVSGLSANGNVLYEKGEIAVNSTVALQRLNIAKIEACAVSSTVSYAHDRLSLDHLTASLHNGVLEGHVSVEELSKKKSLQGEATVRDVDVKALTAPFTTLSIGGKLASLLHMRGTLDRPQINFLTEIEDARVDKIDLGTAQFEGTASKEHLMVPKFSVLMSSGFLDGENFSIDFNSEKLNGLMSVNDVNLAAMFSHYFGRIDGDIDGAIGIEGTYRDPIVSAKLFANKLTALGMKLGSGPLDVALERRPLLGRHRVNDLVFSISANLREQMSSNMVRFAIALNRQTINTEIKFDDLELNTADLPVDSVVGIRGRVSGEITGEGKAMAPDFRAYLIAKEYGIFDPAHRDGANSVQSFQGPAVLHASSKASRLTLDLCANLSEATGGVVCQDGGLQLALAGPFRMDEFSLTLGGRIDHPHLENVVPILKKELATLDAQADLHGKLTRTKQHGFRATTNVKLTRFLASLPNIPIIKLTQPVSLSVDNESVEIKGDANLEFQPGNLALRGAISKNEMDVHLVGEIPLMASRFVLPIVQRADGLAKGDITLSGSFDQPIVEGKIVPQPKSIIRFKKWFESMELREGALSFDKTGPASFLARFDNFKLGLGDGKLFVNGIFDKRYAYKNKEAKSKFDLEVVGSNVVLRDQLDFVEADFTVHTKHVPGGGSIAKGDITITDGSAYRQFDLRNFVAQAQGSKAGVSKFLNALDMKMDFDIAIRQFNASARMLNIDIDTLLRGQLVAQGPIAHPKFKGSIVVTEGAIKFPATSFDLMESQIVLDENSDRVFDPKINIEATQDLTVADYPQLQSDTTVEFSLRGDLDRLNLGLRPVRGDMRLSQLKIFLLLLSPRGGGFDEVVQGDVLRKGAQNAAMAFTGEVFFRPLANELQDLLEGRTKTRIQFGAGLDSGGASFRFNWKLGPRIEVFGSYAFLSEDARQRERARDLMESQYSLADLKLKLLLFDHRPIGPLFLETSFGTVQDRDRSEPRGKIRLKYRVLSQ